MVQSVVSVICHASIGVFQVECSTYGSPLDRGLVRNERNERGLPSVAWDHSSLAHPSHSQYYY
jgi:hypothetical protein